MLMDHINSNKALHAEVHWGTLRFSLLVSSSDCYLNFYLNLLACQAKLLDPIRILFFFSNQISWTNSKNVTLSISQPPQMLSVSLTVHICLTEFLRKSNYNPLQCLPCPRVHCVSLVLVDCPAQLTPIFILWYLYFMTNIKLANMKKYTGEIC